MNYRHAFRAGGFADVIKHIVLVRMLTYLQEKPAAFRVSDTRAGAGRYDLTGGKRLTGIARADDLRTSALPVIHGLIFACRAVDGRALSGRVRHGYRC